MSFDPAIDVIVKLSESVFNILCHVLLHCCCCCCGVRLSRACSIFVFMGVGGELGEEVVPAGYRPCCCALDDRRSSRTATLVAKLCDMSQ